GGAQIAKLDSLLLSAFFFFSSRRRHTRWPRDWSSDVCSSDLVEHVTGRRAYYLGKPNGYMFHRAHRKLAELALGEPELAVMIGDTMETDIRGAVESGMHSFLVLSGSTQLEDVGDYVYQPTRILQSVADLTEEVRTGKASDRLTSPVFADSGAH